MLQKSWKQALRLLLVANLLLGGGYAQAADSVIFVGQLRNGLEGNCLDSYTRMVTCDARDPKQVFTFENGTFKNALGHCLSAITNPDGQVFPGFYSIAAVPACGSEQWRYNPSTQQIANASNQCLFLPPWALDLRQCSTVPEASETWQFLAVTNPPIIPPPLLVEMASGQCLTISNTTIANDPRPFNPNILDCVGGQEQAFTHNGNNQVVNANGQCLAAYTAYGYVIFDTCKLDGNHSWQSVQSDNNRGLVLQNSALGLCLTFSDPWNPVPLTYPDNKLITSTCNVENPSRDISLSKWGFTVSTQITTPTVVSLVPKNDSYNAIANVNHGQMLFDIPAAKGVRANDTPSGWPAGLTFAVVSQITHAAGGKANAELFFRDTGGFYVILRTTASTMKQRMADKRGIYTFTYKMVMNGQASTPATVTLNVR